jgi:hypothetical protein
MNADGAQESKHSQTIRQSSLPVLGVCYAEALCASRHCWTYGQRLPLETYLRLLRAANLHTTPPEAKSRRVCSEQRMQKREICTFMDACWAK